MDQLGACAASLAALFERRKHLCVGLDSDLRRIPSSVLPGSGAGDRVLAFNAAIIEATSDIASAYKPNLAFYESLGAEGWRVLAGTIREVRRLAPDARVILDGKRADIGSSNLGYVHSLFDELRADAVTVHPYLGQEALGPFLMRREALIFVLARTSNPGSGEFQDLLVDGLPLFRHVARAVDSRWNARRNCGLVVGATYPDELSLIRQDVDPSMPFLIPGIGAQGGELAPVVAAHVAARSTAFLLNVSRSVLYASDTPDFAASARAEAQRVNAAILTALDATPETISDSQSIGA